MEEGKKGKKGRKKNKRKKVEPASNQVLTASLPGRSTGNIGESSLTPPQGNSQIQNGRHSTRQMT